MAEHSWTLDGSRIVGGRRRHLPDRPIRVIVPYGAGQATDVMCRVFLEQLKVVLNQPIVIENRVGAAGNLGSGKLRAQHRTATRSCAPVMPSMWPTH